MRKEAKANLKYFALMLFLVVAVVAIVYAATPVLVSTGGSTVSVDEDVGYVYNISVNNTDQGGIDNITQVNITFNSNFLANASTTNATYANNGTVVTNFVFANTTGVLSWLINITNATNNTRVYFVFNATATNPGNFNFSVLTVNMTTGFTNSTNISVTVNDTTAPTAVTINSPTADGTNLSQSNIVINATVTDNYGNATGPNPGEAMKIRARLFDSARAIINSSNSTGLFNNQTNFTGLADGIYYVNATGNDSGDNALVSSTFKVTLDTTYPQNISFGTQTQNDGVNVTANSTYVNVTSYNDTNFINVTFTLWNTTSVVNSTTFNSTPMTYTINWTNLPDGNYTYAVNVTDAVNQVNSTGLRKIVLDKTVPAVTLRTPTAGGNYSGNLILNATATDVTVGMRDVYFNITLRNNTESSNFTVAFKSGSEWNVTINTVNYIEGEYNITVYANDSAGNTNSTVGVILFRFDNRVPNITAIRNPVSGGNYSGNLILNASVADPTAGVSNVYFNITPRNNTANHTFVKAVQSGTEWNVTIATTAYEEGVYNITVYANDTAGNSNSTVSVTQVTLDNRVPNITAIRNPVSGRNYSGNLILNASVADATAGVSNVYFNITATNNTANHTFVKAVQSGTEWNVTIATTAYAHGTYNITVSANDTAGNVNRTVSVIQMIFDNVAPNVSAIIRPVNSGNYSGNLILNATVVADTPSGISSVFFNISNASWSVFLRAFQAGNQWNITINTSNGSFKDSKYYNVTVYVNDTAGNLNSSEKSTLITIDNTAPAITHTCTPTSTTAGNTGGIACTCTATDAIATPVVDYTAAPSVVDTGTFTTRCTASDYTGNSALSDVTYTVTSSTSSGGGGGGGGAGVSASVTKTYSITEEQAEVGYINIIKENEQVKLAITITVPATAAGAGPTSVTENHYVKVADVVNKSVTITVSSTPQTVTLSEGEEKKFEVTNDTFYDISVKLNGIVSNKANLTIKSIHEEMPKLPSAEQNATAGETGAAGEGEAAGATNLAWLWIVLVVIVVVIVIIAIAAKKGGKGRR